MRPTLRHCLPLNDQGNSADANRGRHVAIKPDTNGILENISQVPFSQFGLDVKTITEMVYLENI